MDHWAQHYTYTHMRTHICTHVHTHMHMHIQNTFTYSDTQAHKHKKALLQRGALFRDIDEPCIYIFQNSKRQNWCSLHLFFFSFHYVSLPWYILFFFFALSISLNFFSFSLFTLACILESLSLFLRKKKHHYEDCQNYLFKLTEVLLLNLYQG